ncbi:transposase zinc-binding domain-containing protein [Solibacillus sp. FSL H8-0538]|uniref:transposase zinc-binding domain-containing protein n=1 Tax=Solibacillus sp. FSL H8-0538 TaxID=2921400 RepID=UPI0030F89D79
MQFDHRGIIKRMLNDHFDGFWRMNQEAFPAAYRQDILETVQKTIRCGSKDMGHIRYECLGCPGGSKPVFVYFSCKSRFCNKCEKNIRMIGQINNRSLFSMCHIVIWCLRFQKKYEMYFF